MYLRYLVNLCSPFKGWSEQRAIPGKVEALGKLEGRESAGAINGEADLVLQKRR